MVDPCAHCGASVEAEAKVCGSCGQPLPRSPAEVLSKDVPAADVVPPAAEGAPAPEPSLPESGSGSAVAAALPGHLPAGGHPPPARGLARGPGLKGIPRTPGAGPGPASGPRPAAAPGPRRAGAAVKPRFNPVQRRVRDQLRDETKKGATALLAIAVINGLFGLGAGFFLKFAASKTVSDLEYLAIAFTFVYALVFIGLHIWSRKKPLPALVAGLVLFEGPFLAGIALGLSPGIFGFLFSGVVTLILLGSISAALWQKKIARARPSSPPEPTSA